MEPNIGVAPISSPVIVVSRKDKIGIVIIGAAVGLLSQIIIGNLLPEAAFPLRVGVFVAFTILAPVALYAAAFLGRIKPVLYQFAKFAATGVLNTFVDLGVLNLAILLSGQFAGVAFGVFKAISFLVANANSYFWNKYWAFAVGGSATGSEAVKFLGVSLVGLAVNVGVAALLVNVVGSPAGLSPKLWANAAALAGVVAALVANFVGYKYLVFKK